MGNLSWLVLVGLAWAPAAAVLCAAGAQAGGVGSRGAYARRGAVYALLLVLPSLYLISRLYGRRIPGWAVFAGYGFIFLLWTASTGSFLLMAWAIYASGWLEGQPLPILDILVTHVPAAVNILAMGISLTALLGQSFRGRRYPGISAPASPAIDGYSIPQVNLMPFQFTLGSLLVSPFIYLIWFL